MKKLVGVIMVLGITYFYAHIVYWLCINYPMIVALPVVWISASILGSYMLYLIGRGLKK